MIDLKGILQVSACLSLCYSSNSSMTSWKISFCGLFYSLCDFEILDWLKFTMNTVFMNILAIVILIYIDRHLQKYLKQQVWTCNAHQPRNGLNWEGDGSNSFKAAKQSSFKRYAHTA